MSILFDILIKLIISFAFGLGAFIVATNIPLFSMRSDIWAMLSAAAVGFVFFILFAIAWIFELYIVMLVLFILFTLVYVGVIFISWIIRLLKK